MLKCILLPSDTFLHAVTDCGARLSVHGGPAQVRRERQGFANVFGNPGDHL